MLDRPGIVAGCDQRVHALHIIGRTGFRVWSVKIGASYSTSLLMPGSALAASSASTTPDEIA